MMEEVLREKIEMVETAHLNTKHGLSWQIINEITGRRASQKGQIAGNTQTERLQSWYRHFQISKQPSKQRMTMRRPSYIH